jgi:hypothetical protein
LAGQHSSFIAQATLYSAALDLAISLGDFLLTVKANQKTLHRQICDQLRGNRKIHLLATGHEISHGCVTT